MTTMLKFNHTTIKATDTWFIVSATCLISLTGAVNSVDSSPDDVAALNATEPRIPLSTIASWTGSDSFTFGLTLFLDLKKETQDDNTVRLNGHAV